MNEDTIKLFDSELKVMSVLWKEGDMPAKNIADILNKKFGWNKNTTYTLIKRCIKKGAIERSEPKFICHALISKETVQEAETNELIDKMYEGSPSRASEPPPVCRSLLRRSCICEESITTAPPLISIRTSDKLAREGKP